MFRFVKRTLPKLVMRNGEIPKRYINFHVIVKELLVIMFLIFFRLFTKKKNSLIRESYIKQVKVPVLSLIILEVQVLLYIKVTALNMAQSLRHVLRDFHMN